MPRNAGCCQKRLYIKNLMDNRQHHPLLCIYAALLRLYPPDFQQQFGQDMLATFSQVLEGRGGLSAALLILRELLPTLFREHLDDPANLVRVIRWMLAAVPALLIYAAAVGRVQHVEEFILSTFWLMCILTAFWKSGCRGRICLRRTMAASVLGMLLPLALINWYQPMSPGFFSLAGPFALLAMTLGLILAVFARLIMEGIKLRAAV